VEVVGETQNPKQIAYTKPLKVKLSDIIMLDHAHYVTSTHQCNIHLKPVMIRLWMNTTEIVKVS
jgi:hypothetical protein